MAFSILLKIILLFNYVFLEPISKESTMVLYDDASVLKSHSELISMYAKISTVFMENSATFKTPLTQLKTNIFKNLLLLVSKNAPKNFVEKYHIEEFLDFGGNMMILTSSECTDEIRKLIKRIGFLLIPAQNQLSKSYTTFNDKFIFPLNSSNIIDSNIIINKKDMDLSDVILYKGSGLRTHPDNKQSISILNTDDDVFFLEMSTNLYKPSHINGLASTLIAGSQMRNNHRLIVIPSLNVFTNEFFNMVYTPTKGESLKYPKNRFVAKQLIDWVLMKKGVLKVTISEHSSLKTFSSKKPYTVMEKIRYLIKVYEETEKGDIPYKTPSKIDFELLRIISHVYIPYNSSVDGEYYVEFHIPDYIGLYKCKTIYDRVGYSLIDHYTQIVVAPRKHNEFPRFISGLWPFYVTAFVMMFMTFILLFVLIHTKESFKEKTE